MDWLYNQLIAGKQKAVTAFIVGFIATQLAQHGVQVDAVFAHGFLDNVVYAALLALGVYLKRNQA